jgi:hypothetical protein
MSSDHNGPLELTVDLSEEGRRAFIEALRTDEDYRTWLREHPVEALAHHGITVAPESLPETIELPSPDELSVVSDVLRPRGLGQSSCLLWGLIAYCASGSGE